MRLLKLSLLSTVALLGLWACSDEETPGNENTNPDNGNSTGGTTYDESYYASHASVDSYDTRYESGSGGGTISFSSQGGTVTLNVDCGVEWSAENRATDLFEISADTSAGTVTVTAGENGTDDNLTGTFVLKTTASGIEFATVTVIRHGVIYLDLSRSYVSLKQINDKAEVTVDSNYDWDFDYDSSNGWFTVSRTDEVLTITATAGPEEDVAREAEVTVTAGEAGESIQAVIRVVEHAAGDADMILQYTVTAGNRKITLPLTGDVDCTVDWGDGETETVTAELPTHTFSASGTYEVTVSGTVTALNSSTLFSEDNYDTSLTAVLQWGDLGLTDMTYAFYCCSKLASIPADDAGGFARVTSFSYAFYRCSLTEIPEGLFDSCEEAVYFNYTFYCNKLTSIPAYLFRGLSKAEEFVCVFQGNYNLTTVGHGLFKDCTSANTFRYAFAEANLTDISGDIFEGCSSIDNLSFIFAYNQFTEVPYGIFDYCQNATNFFAAFYCCKNLTSVPEDLFYNCTNAEAFTSVFYLCTGLVTVPEKIFSRNLNATSFHMAFQFCSSLESVSEDLFVNNTKVENAKQCFAWCTSLKFIPEGLLSPFKDITALVSVFLDCESVPVLPENIFKYNTEVTDFTQIFYMLVGIPNVPTGIFDYNKKVENFTSAFYALSTVTGESPYTVVDGVKVHLWERNESNGFTVPTTYSSCFKGAVNLSDYYSIPSNWGGGSSSTTSIPTGWTGGSKASTAGSMVAAPLPEEMKTIVINTEDGATADIVEAHTSTVWK